MTHYWILDPLNRTLTVFRWTPVGYVVALGSGEGMTVRAEPFADIELRVGSLLS